MLIHSELHDDRQHERDGRAGQVGDLCGRIFSVAVSRSACRR